MRVGTTDILHEKHQGKSSVTCCTNGWYPSKADGNLLANSRLFIWRDLLGVCFLAHHRNLLFNPYIFSSSLIPLLLLTVMSTYHTRSYELTHYLVTFISKELFTILKVIHAHSLNSPSPRPQSLSSTMLIRFNHL